LVSQEFDCLFSRCISGYTCELKPQNVAVSAAFSSPLDSTLIWSAVYACNRAYECWLIGPKWQRRSQVTQQQVRLTLLKARRFWRHWLTCTKMVDFKKAKLNVFIN